jgi:hypothetical protein
LAARNILGSRFNLWQLHADEGYLDEGVTLTENDILALEASQPWIPKRV